MKYILKFVIDQFYPNKDRYYLTIKVNNDEEQLKKNGILEVGIDIWHDYEAKYFRIHFKDYEIVEGKLEIPEVYHLLEQGDNSYKEIQLKTERFYTDAKFMGYEPIADEEPQSISPPKEGE